MASENNSESATEKSNQYAYWAIPDSTDTVTYALPVFHEIDFAVNEGYRKIPHGGIEEGGLLFGVVDEKGTRVEAFRQIACEHASGPSFLLSEHDIQRLNAQIAAAPHDPDLQGLELVGWFLAHTRGPLALTDREVELCDLFFRLPGMLTVLVKPERFQPTRFGFLVRGKDRSLPRDVAQNAVILPLPGRNTKAGIGPMASIPAPAINSAIRRPVEREMAAAAKEVVAEEKPLEQQPATEAAPPPVDRVARRQPRLSIDQVRPREEEEQKSAQTSEAAARSRDIPPSLPPFPKRGGELETFRRGALAPLSSERSLAVPRPVEEINAIPDPYEQIELLNKKSPTSTTARMVMVLPLAALLGCLVGYVAYLQVPSPIIPLTVKTQGSNLIVSWPAEQTRNAVYAAVRLDDGTPEMLTAEEKNAGHVKVEAAPDRKVELIARNWIHDSRGIVHYVKPVANTAP